jgi:hypothetical protein
MNQDTLEARVARLEQQVDRLVGGGLDLAVPAADDWKQTVGMFRDDEIVGEMIEHSQLAREEERNRLRDRRETGPACSASSPSCTWPFSTATMRRDSRNCGLLGFVSLPRI